MITWDGFNPALLRAAKPRVFVDTSWPSCSNASILMSLEDMLPEFRSFTTSFIKRPLRLAGTSAFVENLASARACPNRISVSGLRKPVITARLSAPANALAARGDTAATSPSPLRNEATVAMSSAVPAPSAWLSPSAAKGLLRCPPTWSSSIINSGEE